MPHVFHGEKFAITLLKEPIGLWPALHCQPSRYLWCSVYAGEIGAISGKDRKLVCYHDLHRPPPPNAGVYGSLMTHIWSEDWPGSGNLSQIEGYGGGVGLGWTLHQ